MEMFIDTQCLEAELSKEPLVLARVVPLLQQLLHLLARSNPRRRVVGRIHGHRRLDAIAEVERVPRRHQVVVVDGLDKRLDAGALGERALVHRLRDLERVPLNAGYEGMAKAALIRALVHGVHDDRLLTGKAAAKDNHDLPRLQAAGEQQFG